MTNQVPEKAQRETHLTRRVAQLAEGMPEFSDVTLAQVDKLAKAVVVDWCGCGTGSAIQASAWRSVISGTCCAPTRGKMETGRRHFIPARCRAASLPDTCQPKQGVPHRSSG
jgi:O-succinylbenzoate synthase